MSSPTPSAATGSTNPPSLVEITLTVEHSSNRPSRGHPTNSTSSSSTPTKCAPTGQHDRPNAPTPASAFSRSRPKRPRPCRGAATRRQDARHRHNAGSRAGPSVGFGARPRALSPSRTGGRVVPHSSEPAPGTESGFRFVEADETYVVFFVGGLGVVVEDAEG